MSAEDAALLAGLRRRDEAAFTTLVEKYHQPLIRLARRYIFDKDAAEEVVQDTWIAVLNGVDRFEGRSSLRTWIFRILTNQSFTRRGKDARADVPFSALAEAEAGTDEPSVDSDRFHSFWFLRDRWRTAPEEWGESPEQIAVRTELRNEIMSAIARLPEAQATVLTLHDVQGFSTEEICETLGITANNCRVLLHRGRAKVRTAIESKVRVRRP